MLEYTPLGRHIPGQTPTPPDGNYCRRYASYWNAFLYSDVLYKQRPFNAANHQIGEIKWNVRIEGLPLKANTPVDVKPNYCSGIWNWNVIQQFSFK